MRVTLPSSCWANELPSAHPLRGSGPEEKEGTLKSYWPLGVSALRSKKEAAEDTAQHDEVIVGGQESGGGAY